MSPLSKMKKYGRFPFKFVSHLLIVLVGTMYVIVQNLEYNTFLQASQRSFRNILMNNLDLDPDGSGRIYTINSIKAQQTEAVTNFFSFHNRSVGEIMARHQTAVMTVYPFDTSREPSKSVLTADDMLGPLNRTVNELRSYFDSLEKIEIEYLFSSTHLSRFSTTSQFRPTVFLWTCTAVFDLSVDIEARYSLHFSSRPEHLEVLHN